MLQHACPAVYASLKGERRLTGTIRSPSGLPVPAIFTLHLVGPRWPNWRGPLSADDQGRFAVEDLEPGDYRLSVRTKGSPPQSVFTGDLSISPTADVERNVDLVPAVSQRVRFRFLNPSGDPLQRVSVTTFPDYESAPDRPAIRATTTDEGTIEAELITGAQCRVKWYAKGWRVTEEVPLIPSATNFEFTVRMRPYSD